MAVDAFTPRPSDAAVLSNASKMAEPAGATITHGRRGLVMAVGALFVLYLLWQLTRLGGHRHQELIGDLFNVPFYVLAIGATLGAAHRCRGTRRLARAWRLLAVGNACYLAGDLMQTYEEVVSHHLRYPSVADIAYLSFYAFFFAGLVGFARSARSNTRRAMLGLDVLTVALGGAAVIWYFDAGPSVLAGGQPWDQVMLAVAYPLGDLLLLLGATATLLRDQPRSSKRSLTVVTTGVGLYVLADLIWSYIILHGTYHGGDRVDTVWIAATALFSLGAVLQPTTGPADLSASRAGSSRRAGWLPYSALCGTFALLVFVQRHDAVFPNLVITFIAVAVAVAVGARQQLAQRALAEEQAHSQDLLGQLRHQASHDSLTGVANRALFNERLDHALARGPVPGRHQAVLMIDLDGFKEVNDRFGHDAGDQLLIAVAERLRASIRHSDTVARMGGDEFVVLTELSGAADAMELAGHLLHALSQPLFIATHEITPRASIGIAVSDHDAVGPTALLRAADVAMYQAKAGGRNRVCLFEGPLVTTAA